MNTNRGYNNPEIFTEEEDYKNEVEKESNDAKYGKYRRGSNTTPKKKKRK